MEPKRVCALTSVQKGKKQMGRGFPAHQIMYVQRILHQEAQDTYFQGNMSLVKKKKNLDLLLENSVHLSLLQMLCLPTRDSFVSV